MGDAKGCNKWLTYALGLLALVFLILTIVFGVKVGDRGTTEEVREVEKIVYVKHPMDGDGETSLRHAFFDPLVEEGARAKINAGAPELSAAVEAIYLNLTHAQRIGQLVQFAFGDASGPGMEGVPSLSDWFDLARQGAVGSFLNVIVPLLGNALQSAAVEGTGIPLLMGFDVIHGYHTIFPNPLGLAASWDPNMVEELSALSAREAKEDGIRWTFAPMVDVARDPRWGRMMEGWGEDGYLHSVFGPAVVRGFQNEKVAACVKHISAYGIPDAGKDYSGNEYGWVHLHNEYFEGYEAAIAAGALTSMASFNLVAGIPAHGNRELLTDVQRGMWGLRGICVSDYGGTREMTNHRFLGENRTEAALKSFLAGIDMNMADGYYRELLEVDPKWTYLNHTFEEYVDLSARRVVWVKEQIGLFEDLGIVTYKEKDRFSGSMTRTAEQDAVREAAERSAVLLKNDNSALPVDPLDMTNSILIVGRIADDYVAHLGFWNGASTYDLFVGKKVWTFLKATDELCGTDFHSSYNLLQGGNWCVGDEDPEDESTTTVEFSQSEKPISQTTCNIDYLPGYACQLNLNLTKDEKQMIKVEEAIAANDYTHIIFLAGESSYQNGEGSGRAHLELPHAQSLLSRRIVEAVAKKVTKPKLILVPIIARPNILTYEDENYDAIMTPWAPGSLGGHAIWNLLSGKISPGGSLPVTFPRSMGQIPIYHEMANTGRPYPETSAEYPPYLGADNTTERFKSRYIDEKDRPLYPFGYGLSYAEFSVSRHSIGPNIVNIKEDTTIIVDFSVERSGTYTGNASKIYQVYVGQLKGTPVPPKKRVRGFARLDFVNGATTASGTITLVPSKDLARFDPQLNRRVEPGIYTIYLGEHAEDNRFQANISVVD